MQRDGTRIWERCAAPDKLSASRTVILCGRPSWLAADRFDLAFYRGPHGELYARVVRLRKRGGQAPAAWFGNSHAPAIQAESQAKGSVTWFVVFRPGRRPKTVLYHEPGPEMDGFAERDAARKAHEARWPGAGSENPDVRRLRVYLDENVDPGAD